MVICTRNRYRIRIRLIRKNKCIRNKRKTSSLKPVIIGRSAIRRVLHTVKQTSPVFFSRFTPHLDFAINFNAFCNTARYIYRSHRTYATYRIIAERKKRSRIKIIPIAIFNSDNINRIIPNTDRLVCLYFVFQ